MVSALLHPRPLGAELLITSESCGDDLELLLLGSHHCSECQFRHPNRT